MIYVLVPAYNEASTIGLLLWKVRQVFTEFAREYQLMVANDGSTDGTDDVLAPYTRALPLTVVTHRRRQGYASSLEELMRLAVERTDRPRRDLAVTLQADFTDSPEDVAELAKRVEGGADIVIADGRRQVGPPRAARLARRLAGALIGPTLHLEGVDDYVGSLRAYRLTTLARLFRDRPGAPGAPALTWDGWAANVELLARASRYARRIESVPTTGAVMPRQRASRAAPLRSALAAWSAARALRSLARTAAPAQPEPTPSPA